MSSNSYAVQNRNISALNNHRYCTEISNPIPDVHLSGKFSSSLKNLSQINAMLTSLKSHFKRQGEKKRREREREREREEKSSLRLQSNFAM